MAEQQTISLSPADIEDLTSTVCIHCGHEVYGQGLVIKELPSVHPANPTGEMKYISISTTVCIMCKKPTDKV